MQKMYNKIKEKIVNILMNYKNRTYICINMGTLFMGIFMFFIGTYSPICGDVQNETRKVIGIICIVIWFIAFPTISIEEKDRLILTILKHFYLTIIILIISLLEVNYFFAYINKGKLFWDILFCIGGIVVFSYLIYIFVGFIKTFFYLVEKIKKFV